MARNLIPAWQQVLLTALNNVPKAKTGQEAWQKLNAEEQAAVMDFLAEHCGENAQAALEDACGKIKRPKWWTWCWMIVDLILFVVLGVPLLRWLEAWIEMDLTPFLWVGLLCPMNMWTAWRGSPAEKMQEIWKNHVNTRYGTTLALSDMYRACTAPRWARMNKAGFIFWLVMLVLWGFATAWEIADHRGPSVPRQIVSVLEDVADGRGSLADADVLLADWSDLRRNEHIADAWDKTAPWSDERYLVAALAVRHAHPDAAVYAREALLTTRLGALDTPVESAEFSALLALCGDDTAQAVRDRVIAVEFPEKPVLLDVLNAVRP